MDSEEPGGKEVEEVVEAVGVCDAVDGCVQRREEREDIRDVSCSARDSGSHLARAHDLYDEHQRQDRKQIVVRAEGRQPVDSKVVDPDDQHWHVDWKDPEHEDQHRGCVVVEVVVCAGASVAGEAEGSYAGA